VQIFSEIVGAHFRPSEAKAVHNSLTIGDEVSLLAEPDNKYDPNAVQVLVDDVHVGYVARINNYEIADYLNDGGDDYTATVNRKEGNKFVLLIDFPFGDEAEDAPSDESEGE
jgi:hypothetical protein